MDHALIKNVISYLIIASIFVTGEGFKGPGFDFYWYYPFYLLFVVYGVFAYHRLNVKIAAVFASIILYSLLSYEFTIGPVIKQIVNVCFSAAVFYYMLWHENFNLRNIFEKYIGFAKIVLILGFIQVFLFAVALGSVFTNVFPFLQNYPVHERLQSITQEPSYIAFTFAPIIFIALHNLFFGTRYFLNRTWSILFLVGYLLTQSSVAYIGLLMSIGLLYFKNFSVRKLQYAMIAFSGVVLIAYFLYSTIHPVRVRVDDTLYAISEDITQKNVYLNVNLSTYALLSNFYVTRKSLEENPWTGTGLGTHELAYDKHLPAEMHNYMILNREDANSMALRMLTEVGVIGFVLFCIYIAAFKIRSRAFFITHEELLWLINSGIFIVIFLSLLRNGNYTLHGKILFFIMYYYSYKQVKESARSAENRPFENQLSF